MNDQMNRKAAANSRVYICTPSRPVLTDPILRANELIGNLKLARDAADLAVIHGYEPMVPQLSFPKFVDGETPEEHELMMLLAMRALETCSEVWIVSCRISEGMSAVIKRAKMLGIPVKVFTTKGFRRYIGTGDMTDNCVIDTMGSLLD